MKTFIRQIFCNHIWKELDTVMLRSTREAISTLEYADFDYYGVTRECIKCGKHSLTEKRVMII